MRPFSMLASSFHCFETFCLFSYVVMRQPVLDHCSFIPTGDNDGIAANFLLVRMQLYLMNFSSCYGERCSLQERVELSVVQPWCVLKPRMKNSICKTSTCVCLYIPLQEYSRYKPQRVPLLVYFYQQICMYMWHVRTINIDNVFINSFS